VRPKNVACVKALLAVALTDDNILRDSWSAVLNCTSLLAQLQLSASRLATDDAFFSADAATDGSATSAAAANPSRASVKAETKL
jgi:brefeldin A-inhibited guanine nucleotide-exchange protein